MLAVSQSLVKYLFGKIVYRLLVGLVLYEKHILLVAICVRILSGPTALPGFNSCNNFSIPCVVNSILAMIGYLGKLMEYHCFPC